MGRRRRRKRTGLLGAFVLEVGTLLAIIAAACPQWAEQMLERLPRAIGQREARSWEQMVRPPAALEEAGESAAPLL